MVESIEVVNENKFIWNVRCSENCSAKIGCTVSGRKNKAIVNIEDFEGSEGDSDPSVHKNTLVFKKLHRLQLKQSKRKLTIPLCECEIGFEKAKAYRQYRGLYLRKNQWTDLKVQVWVNV